MSAVSQSDALAAVHELERDTLTVDDAAERFALLRRFIEERGDLTTQGVYAQAALTGLLHHSGAPTTDEAFRRFAATAHGIARAMVEGEPK